jgi:hypothetical protein
MEEETMRTQHVVTAPGVIVFVTVAASMIFGPSVVKGLRFHWQDWQQDRAARRAAIARHPASKRLAVHGCQCTPCRVLRGAPRTLTAPSPEAVRQMGRKPWPPRTVTLTGAEWDAWLEVEAWLEGSDPGWADITRMFPREATNYEEGS